MGRVAAADLIAATAASAAGRRLLAVLRDPHAETRRAGRRGPRIAGELEGVAITGDALVDLIDGREPAVHELTWPGDVHTLANELRVRLRGEVVRRAWHDVVELRASDGTPLAVRLRPNDDAAEPHSLAQAMPHLRPIAGGAWSDPVLTARAARLRLDGSLEDPDGDLAGRRVRLRDPDALRRRPEAVLHVARLGSRPGWTIEPATLAAAREARRAGAPASGPVVHVGAALATLLIAPEAIPALELLQRLAPEVPLAGGVEIDGERLRGALAAPAGDRFDVVLRALAPGASARRIAAFRRGAGLRELDGLTDGGNARSRYWSSEEGSDEPLTRRASRWIRS